MLSAEIYNFPLAKRKKYIQNNFEARCLVQVLISVSRVRVSGVLLLQVLSINKTVARLRKYIPNYQRKEKDW